jgi:hypothetical protein
MVMDVSAMFVAMTTLRVLRPSGWKTATWEQQMLVVKDEVEQQRSVMNGSGRGVRDSKCSL